MLEFSASRLTEGNRFFPARLVLTLQDVTCVKPKLLGSNSVTFSYDQIATVDLQLGVMFGTLKIESSGGRSIELEGLSRGEARRVRELILKGCRGELTREDLEGQQAPDEIDGMPLKGKKKPAAQDGGDFETADAEYYDDDSDLK